MKLYLIISLLILSVSAHAADPAVTDKLNGTEFTYKYSGGWEFTIRYEKDGVSYRMLNYRTGWKGPFKFNAFEVSKGVFFTSWYDTSRDDYVTHYIDLNNKRLLGSVLLGGEEIHFQSAIISQITRQP